MPLIKRKYCKNKIKMGRKMCTLGFFAVEAFTFFPFLLMAESIALAGSFKVKSPWKIGGTSICWAPLSQKFLIHSLISNYHDLNLGECSPTLDGKVKGISKPNTNILIMFSLLKPKDATIAGKAKVERCPNTPWSKRAWR